MLEAKKNLEVYFQELKPDVIIVHNFMYNLTGSIFDSAKKYNIPVIAFAGKIGDGTDVLSQEGITLIFPIVDQPMSLEEAMQNGPKLLYKAAKRLILILILSCNENLTVQIV